MPTFGGGGGKLANNLSATVSKRVRSRTIKQEELAGKEIGKGRWGREEREGERGDRDRGR